MRPEPETWTEIFLSLLITPYLTIPLGAIIIQAIRELIRKLDNNDDED